MAAVLKTAMGRELHRGFESHTLRHVLSQDIEDTPNPRLQGSGFRVLRGGGGVPLGGPGGLPVGWQLRSGSSEDGQRDQCTSTGISSVLGVVWPRRSRPVRRLAGRTAAWFLLTPGLAGRFGGRGGPGAAPVE